MTARPEVGALINDLDVERTGASQRFGRREDRPFTAEETEQVGSATDDIMCVAARRLASEPRCLAELIAPHIHAVAEDAGDRRPPAESA